MRHHIGTAVLLSSLFMAASLLPLGACAAANDVASDQAPVVRHACTAIVGLEPGEVHFDGCVTSLSQSSAAMRANASLVRGREACMAKGLQPDTPALSPCILSFSQPTDNIAPSAGISPAGNSSNATPTPVSYFSTPPRARHERMQYACGALGLDPTESGFDGCVANLQATLLALDHPKY